MRNHRNILKPGWRIHSKNATKNFLNFHHRENGGKGENLGWPLERPISIEGWKPLQFAYSTDGENWSNIGPVLDATRLSDEYANGFTGGFVGLCAQDLDGLRTHADFDWFECQEKP